MYSLRSASENLLETAVREERAVNASLSGGVGNGHPSLAGAHPARQEGRPGEPPCIPLFPPEVGVRGLHGLSGSGMRKITEMKKEKNTREIGYLLRSATGGAQNMRFSPLGSPDSH